MKRFLMSFLCILCAMLILFLYNGDMGLMPDADISGAAGLTDIQNITTGDTAGTVYNTYSYSYEYITDISIRAQKASVKILVDDKIKNIIVKTKNSIISGNVSDETLIIESGGDNKCYMDIYIPDRIYTFYLDVNDIEINMSDSLKGVININSEIISADIINFCGKINFKAKSGYVNIKDGTLQTASSVVLEQKGNIYLRAKFSDKKERYIFRTGEGLIKVDTGNILENTLFDVYAIITNDKYSYTPIDYNDYIESVKVELISENGIVNFE